jgi:chemotaxis protein CheZ
MSSFATLKPEYAACVAALTEALRAGDEAAFHAAMDDLVQLRDPDMVSSLRKLAGDLRGALERFSVESRLADIENQIPDARARLTHVMRMTDEAAHRTLDLVEQSGPLAERTAREAAALMESVTAFGMDLQAFEGPVPKDALLPIIRSMEAFLAAARADSELIRRNLADVLLAQGYQDLTGQIIRCVMKLVEELQSALSDLAKLSGDDVEHLTLGVEESGAGQGPAVPGVTKGDVAVAQVEVDALLSGLGM